MMVRLQNWIFGAAISATSLLALAAVPAKANTGPGMSVEPTATTTSFGNGLEIRVLPDPKYTYYIDLVGLNRWNQWVCKRTGTLANKEFSVDDAGAAFKISKTSPEIEAHINASSKTVPYLSYTHQRDQFFGGILKRIHFRVTAVKDGQESTRSNWNSSNPNNIPGANEGRDCAVIR
jgi:hypothetical protein